MNQYLQTSHSKRYHLSLLVCMSTCTRKCTLSFAPAFPPLSLSALASMMRLENYTWAGEMEEANSRMACEVILTVRSTIREQFGKFEQEMDCWHSDLKFVKKFTRTNFWAKAFYTLKTRKSRLFSPAINSKNASLSVIWPNFG